MWLIVQLDLNTSGTSATTGQCKLSGITTCPTLVTFLQFSAKSKTTIVRQVLIKLYTMYIFEIKTFQLTISNQVNGRIVLSGILDRVP